MAATGGESRIPLDAETARCVAAQGFTLDAVLPAEQRKAAGEAINCTFEDPVNAQAYNVYLIGGTAVLGNNFIAAGSTDDVYDGTGGNLVEYNTNPI